MAQSRLYQWFLLGDGIARDVITADIQRYLGPDALVRPGTGTGEYEGQQGYWITAYRTLTEAMIEDLKLDSRRWQAEHNTSERDHRIAQYSDSRTHASRQYYNPTSTHSVLSESSTQGIAGPPPGSSAYGGDAHYVTTTPAYSMAGSGFESSQQHYQRSSPESRSYYTTGSPYGGSASSYYTAAYAPSSRYSFGTTNPSAPSESLYSQTPYAQSQFGPSPQSQTSYGYGNSISANDPSRLYYPQPTLSSASGITPTHYVASDGREYPRTQTPQRAERVSSTRVSSTRVPSTQEATQNLNNDTDEGKGGIGLAESQRPRRGGR